MLINTLKDSQRGKVLGYNRAMNYDTHLNTTSDGKQVIVNIGDSIALGTNQGTDTGPEPYVANSCYYWNDAGNVVQPITTTDMLWASAGSMYPKMGYEYYKWTGGLKPVFVNSATGGATAFPNGSTNNYYDYVQQFGNGVNSAKACLANLKLTNVRAVIIEPMLNDMRNSQDLGAIEYAWNNLIDRVNIFYGYPEIWVMSIGRDENGDGSGYRIRVGRDIQKRSAQRYRNITLMLEMDDYLTEPAGGLYSSSFADVHPCQYGYDFMGAMAIRNLYRQNKIRFKPVDRTYSSVVLDTFRRLPNLNYLTMQEKFAISDYIDYMEAKGEWTAKVDFFYFPLFLDAANCTTDWRRDSKRFTGGQQVANRGGWRVDGTTANRINSLFTPSVDGVKYTQNNAQIGCYLLNNQDVSGANRVIFGVNGGGFLTQLIWNNSTTDKRFVVNSTSNGTRGTGFYKDHTCHIVYRSVSGTDNLTEDYASTPHAFASAGLPTAEITFGCINTNGVYSAPYKGIYGAMFGGAASAAPNGYLYKKLRELHADFFVLKY